MENNCTLIKTSDLRELRQQLNDNNRLKNEAVKEVEDKLNNLISEKDKLIRELKKQLETPLIDPMKLNISLEMVTVYKEKVEYGYSYFKRWETVQIERIPYAELKEINIDLDYPIYKQVINIANLISEKLVNHTKEEIDLLANKKLEELKNIFSDDCFIEFNKLWLIDKIKFLKQIKKRVEKRNTNTQMST